MDITGKPSAYPSDWSIVSNKPAAFPPESHTHPWADVTGKPATFPPEAHTHPGTDITSAVAEADNADTVDSFHANAAPTANQLLPLDGTGKFPASAIPSAPDEGSVNWHKAPVPSGISIIGLSGLTLPPGAHRLLIHPEVDISSCRVSVLNVLHGQTAATTDLTILNGSVKNTVDENFSTDVNLQCAAGTTGIVEWPCSQSLTGTLFFEATFNPSAGGNVVYILEYHDGGSWNNLDTWNISVNTPISEEYSVTNCEKARLSVNNATGDTADFSVNEVALSVSFVDAGAMSAGENKTIDITTTLTSDEEYPRVYLTASSTGLVYVTPGSPRIVELDVKPPIGSIIAWAESLTGVPTLSEGWVECNGQTLSDADSPLNGQTIPDLNGFGGGAQRFLRGATSSGTTGGSEDNLTKADTGSGQFEGHAGGWNAGWHNPPYYEVVWIMRVK